MISSLSATQRTSLFFFSQFMAGGAANAYLGIWLKQQGLSDTQIGLVSSLPFAIILLTNIFVGRLADRASDWRQVIIIGAFASGIFSLGLFGATAFWQILLFFTLTSVAQALVVPVADGAALHLANESGGNLGSFRALATLGYIVTLFAAGFIVMWLGPWTFIPIFIALSLLRGFTSLLLPRFKMQGLAPAPIAKHKFKDFFQAWLFLPLIGWSIVYATHLVLNGFQSLLWSEQGYSSGMISTLIGLGAASEAVAFFAYKRISHKINLRGMIALSGIVTVLRWWAMSYDPQLFWLVPLQLLHGLTFALGFLACVNYIGKSFDKTVAAEAQSFFTVLQLTCGIVVITVFSWVSNAQDGNPYFANSLMALVGFVVIASAYFFKQPAPIAPAQSAQHPSPT